MLFRSAAAGAGSNEASDVKGRDGSHADFGARTGIDDHREGRLRGAGGSTSRAAAGALRLGRAVGAALTEQRVLAHTEAKVVAIVGVVLVAVATVGILWPLVIAIPIAVILLWMAITLFIRAHNLRMARRSQGLPSTRVGPRP